MCRRIYGYDIYAMKQQIKKTNGYLLMFLSYQINTFSVFIIKFYNFVKILKHSYEAAVLNSGHILQHKVSPEKSEFYLGNIKFLKV